MRRVEAGILRLVALVVLTAVTALGTAAGHGDEASRVDILDPGARGPASLSACPVCDEHPLVLVALRHPAMRRFTRELLERECRCWVATRTHAGAELRRQLERLTPDLLVIDAGDFPACCPYHESGFPPWRAVVIGPEPDQAYQEAVKARGAGAWIPRERVGEELGPAMRRVLGCSHDPCPPAPHVHSR